MQNRMEKKIRELTMVVVGGPQEHRSIGSSSTWCEQGTSEAGEESKHLGCGGSKGSTCSCALSACNSALAQHVLCPMVLRQAGSKKARGKAEREGLRQPRSHGRIQGEHCFSVVIIPQSRQSSHCACMWEGEQRSKVARDGGGGRGPCVETFPFFGWLVRDL